MGKTLGTKAALAVVALIWATTASAVEVKYQVNFADPLFGSGQLVLDDQPESTEDGTSIYDFSNVTGQGTAGVWIGGFFRYNPTSGSGAFELSVDGTMATFEDGEPGLNPISAFESLLDEAEDSGVLSWTRLTPFPPGVPDGGKTLVLLSVGLLGLGAGRRILA